MKNTTKCNVDKALGVIGGKWKLILLWHLSKNTMRFSDLEKAITGISQKMLTQSLRALEKDGLVTRKAYNVIPPRVEYSLTKKAISLHVALREIDDWGKKYL